MAGWSILLIALVGVIAFVILSSGGGTQDEASSRFEPVYEFGTADYHALTFDPTRSGVVFFGHHNGIQVSEDNGRTWETMIDEAGRDGMNLVFDPLSPQTLYMAGHNVFMRSDDSGDSWNALRPNLPSLDLHTFGASPTVEGRLYAIPAGMGLYQSDDRGETWLPVSQAVPAGSNSILELPDGTLLLGATDAGILRSEDGGQTWSQSRVGIEIGAVYAIRGDPEGSRLYAGTDHGLYVSTDGGSTWRQTTLDDVWAIVVGVDPSDPMRILVVNTEGKLFASEDGGESWGF